MDGYTDPIRVDARDLRPGDRLIIGATGRDYHTGVLDISMAPLRQRPTAWAPTNAAGLPTLAVTFEDGEDGEVVGEWDETHNPRFPVWACLKLDQPPVVNNVTYVDGYSRAGAEAEFQRVTELFAGHAAEYRTVPDGGIFRFDYVPEGWDLRGSADEPFEPKADVSDDDYDPGHIVEARPPRPLSAAQRVDMMIGMLRTDEAGDGVPEQDPEVDETRAWNTITITTEVTPGQEVAGGSRFNPRGAVEIASGAETDEKANAHPLLDAFEQRALIAMSELQGAFEDASRTITELRADLSYTEQQWEKERERRAKPAAPVTLCAPADVLDQITVVGFPMNQEIVLKAVPPRPRRPWWRRK